MNLVQTLAVALNAYQQRVVKIAEEGGFQIPELKQAVTSGSVLSDNTMISLEDAMSGVGLIPIPPIISTGKLERCY